MGSLYMNVLYYFSYANSLFVGGHEFQYNESYGATSLNRGMYIHTLVQVLNLIYTTIGHGEPQGISRSDTESDKQFSPSHRSKLLV